MTFMSQKTRLKSIYIITHTQKNSGHPEGSSCEHPCLYNNTIIKMRGKFESFAKSVFVFILKEKSLTLQIN